MLAKILAFKFLIILLLLTYTLCEEEVLEFTDKDFETSIEELSTALVFFYAPWCSYCKRLKPDFARAAKELVRNNPPVSLIQVDCTETHTETCDKYAITSYPTLKIFHYGEFYKNYDGVRETGDIVKYMKAEARPTLLELKSISSLEKILNITQEAIVVGFFETKSNLNAVFLEAVKKTKLKCQFAFSSYKGLLIQLGISDGVVIFRPFHLKNKFEQSSVAYSGSADISQLNDFITKNFHGLAGIRKLGNENTFQKPLIVVYFAVDYEKNSKITKYWRNRILVVAKDFEGRVTFAISSTNEFAKELSKVGIESIETDTPVTVAYYSAGRSVLKEEFSIEALTSFAINLLNGQLEIYVKSEPIPETQEGPVTVAVANNFEKVVLNNGKDTLIEFYAPWCGHCKQLAPIYEELAETLVEEDIAIVKMDAIANDIPAPFEVDGYPTVYWVSKDTKDNPEIFDGIGSVSNFIKFIAERATDELKGWDRNGDSKNGFFKFEL